MKSPTQQPPHTLHPSLLREYDIRGIMEETLSATDAYYIGLAFASHIQQQGLGKRICVGFDGRLSSPELEESLVKGMMATGAEVIRIGLGPTPMLYFAARTLEASGAVMVTGSHNPPNHNGFKFMVGKGSLYGEGIKHLGTIINSGDFVKGSGSVTFEDLKEDYVETLLKAFKGQKPLSVAWDSGSGATGEIVEMLCEKLPGRHILLNTKIDGTFPVHHPDPTVPKNLEQLIDTVTKNQCDLGVAFDGDGDRVGVVDNKGRIIWGDQLMVFFARDVLKAQPGQTIIADVKASQTLFDEIAKAGGRPIMWKTGHSLIKAKMAETGAALAGEMSGHIFFADEYFGFDDGIYAAVRALRLLAGGNTPLSDMLDALPKPHNTPEMRIECKEERKFAVIDEVKQRLYAASANVNDVDGVRVLNEDGWWLLRASNTQAALVARCEAYNAEGLKQLQKNLQSQLQASGVALNMVAH